MKILKTIIKLLKRQVVIVDAKQHDSMQGYIKGILTVGEPLLSSFIKNLDTLDLNSLRTIRGFRGMLNATRNRLES